MIIITVSKQLPRMRALSDQSQTTNPIIQRVVPPVIVALAILIGWHLYVVHTQSIVIPSPRSVGSALRRTTLELLSVDLPQTLSRMFWGFSIGVLAGTMLGVAISVNKYIYSGMSPFMEFFRSLPATALFPFFLNFFGENDASHIATAVYIALWITAFNISQAMRRIATKRKNYLGVIGAKWPFMLKHLYLYELLPALLDSCRIALSLTLLVTVAIEMIVGAKNGVGMNIFNAHYLTDYSGMTAAIIIVGFIGLALNKGAEILQARVIYWRDE